MTSRNINTKAYLFVHLCIGHRNTASRFNLDYASVASFDLVAFRLCRCDSALFYSFLFSLCYVISVYLLLHYDDMCSLILEYIIEDYFVRTIHSNMIWYDMIWYDTIWYDMIWYDMINAITCDIVTFVVAPLIGTIWCGTDIW